MNEKFWDVEDCYVTRGEGKMVHIPAAAAVKTSQSTGNMHLMGIITVIIKSQSYLLNASVQLL